MATRSIMQSINLHYKQLTKGFVYELENAQKKKSKEVVLQKKCVDIKKNQIKDFFNEQDSE